MPLFLSLMCFSFLSYLFYCHTLLNCFSVISSFVITSHRIKFPFPLSCIFDDSYTNIYFPITLCLPYALHFSLYSPSSSSYHSLCMCMYVNVGAVVAEEEAQTGARANVLAAAWAAAEVPYLPHHSPYYAT